ncbi:MAG: DNA mismatch repair endonuclease MutL [Firmicutes bacterium]|nr:DNA mismatch repair endonuclease MutL [Bacillota bacterium]
MIKVLDKNVADKIAAGEVIERPISIVKELVENALDAGADNLVVEIKNGGKTYIRVTDNGCGIPCEEVETAFLRHATSKIETASDLDAIDTLGFRGEALASIAAVTRTELVTKTADRKTGTRLVLHGGAVILKEQTGCPDGTTIVITDLFYNTPARLKFMKTDSAESGLIIDFISQMALAYKNVKFRLINNGKILFSTLGDGNRLNTILRVYNDVDARNMVPVSFKEDGIEIEGYISTPAFSKTTRGSQIFFVNGRVVSSKVIERGVTAGYKERLFEGRYPVTYLFLHVDPHTIDVNIHPNKREVRFDHETLVTDFISRAIRDALSTKDAVVDAGNLFRNMDKKISPSKVYERVFEPFREKEPEKISRKEDQVDIKQLLSTIENPASEETSTKAIHHEEGTGPSIEIYEPQLKPFDFSELEITGVIFDTYITAVDGSSFYLIDQHAAHERIFYEKLVGEYESSEKARQSLLVPLIINVSLAVSENHFDWLDALAKMGFTIDEFGSGTFRITEIPMFMELSEAEDFVNQFIENINDSTNLSNKVVIDKLIMMSCKAAVKANDVLRMDEIRALINDLSSCINPFSCPHGRPTFIRLTHYEIEKMFKRV